MTQRKPKRQGRRSRGAQRVPAPNFWQAMQVPLLNQEVSLLRDHPFAQILNVR